MSGYLSTIPLVSTRRWRSDRRTGDHACMQSIWKGSISFGLVSIPVRLFSATEEKDIKTVRQLQFCAVVTRTGEQLFGEAIRAKGGFEEIRGDAELRLAQASGQCRSHSFVLLALVVQNKDGGGLTRSGSAQ